MASIFQLRFECRRILQAVAGIAKLLSARIRQRRKGEERGLESAPRRPADACVNALPLNHRWLDLVSYPSPRLRAPQGGSATVRTCLI